jgi:hypothetical protein
MSKAPNQVTLYSNGIGHFRRTYKVGKENTAIKIPFRKDYIGDVLASLAIFGKVKLVSPPSFTPANANSTQLQIDASNSLRGLLKSLSGAQVRLNTARGEAVGRTGTLLGIESSLLTTSNGNITNDYVVLSEDKGISRILLTDLQGVDFLEDSVKAEIKKALSANFAKIKPESTFLEILLSAEEDTEAVLQYTQPVAAWKMTYGIRQEKGRFALEGAAVIDNNTDEDWNDFTLSVVTGNPITFSTDLASIVIPKRGHVSIVDVQALGNVHLEEATQYEAVGGSARAMKSALRSRGGVESASLQAAPASYSVSNRAGFGMAEAMVEADYAEAGLEQAQVANVEAKEVGDFCVFTSGERINLGSKQSAVVPMFNVALTTAGSVLLYKEQSHARRPFRAVKFKNETAYSLGKGKTVIYQDGVFQGECVLEAAKPNDQRTLPHCLENGVRISLERKNPESRVTSVGFTSGTMVIETHSTRTYEYEYENKKDEAFKVVVDHIKGLATPNYEFSGTELADKEKTTNGLRLYFDLPAKKSGKLVVTEKQLDRQEVHIVGNMQYVGNIVKGKSSILENALYKECLALQKQIDTAQEKIDKLETQVEKLDTQSERVRKNMAAATKEGGATYEKWVSDLDKSETELRTNKSRPSRRNGTR